MVLRNGTGWFFHRKQAVWDWKTSSLVDPKEGYMSEFQRNHGNDRSRKDLDIDICIYIYKHVYIWIYVYIYTVRTVEPFGKKRNSRWYTSIEYIYIEYIYIYTSRKRFIMTRLAVNTTWPCRVLSFPWFGVYILPPPHLLPLPETCWSSYGTTFDVQKSTLFPWQFSWFPTLGRHPI